MAVQKLTRTNSQYSTYMLRHWRYYHSRRMLAYSQSKMVFMPCGRTRLSFCKLKNAANAYPAGRENGWSLADGRLSFHGMDVDYRYATRLDATLHHFYRPNWTTVCVFVKLDVCSVQSQSGGQKSHVPLPIWKGQGDLGLINMQNELQKKRDYTCLLSNNARLPLLHGEWLCNTTFHSFSEIFMWDANIYNYRVPCPT